MARVADRGDEPTSLPLNTVRGEYRRLWSILLASHFLGPRLAEPLSATLSKPRHRAFPNIDNQRLLSGQTRARAAQPFRNDGFPA